jgi:hypothetical protein
MGDLRVRAAAAADRPVTVDVLTSSWGGTSVVAHGTVCDGAALPALLAEWDGRVAGLLTYTLSDVLAGQGGREAGACSGSPCFCRAVQRMRPCGARVPPAGPSCRPGRGPAGRDGRLHARVPVGGHSGVPRGDLLGIGEADDAAEVHGEPHELPGAMQTFGAIGVDDRVTGQPARYCV